MAPTSGKSFPRPPYEVRSPLSISPIAACAGAVLTVAIVLALIFCLHKRRKRDMKRRRELVESLRSGDDCSSDSVDVEPAAEGEPEDIRELFYFYWRQGKNQLANRQAMSAELQSKIDDRVQKERIGPRRQTISGDCVNNPPFNPDVIFEGLQSKKFAVRCPQAKLRGGSKTDTSWDESSPSIHSKRCSKGQKRCSGSSGRSSIDQATGPIAVKQMACADIPEASSLQSDDEIQTQPTDIKIQHSTGRCTEQRGAGNSARDTCTSQNREGRRASGDDLDLSRYIINPNGRESIRRLRRLNSCPDADTSAVGLGERCWSFSSLVIAWDFKKTSVINDIELEFV